MIRTFEGRANGFTVRPLWPLGNPSMVKNSKKNGSPNWTRTSDIMINSHALYRLSY